MTAKNPHSLLKGIGNDFVVFWIMATGAVCIGLLVNQFRDQPLALTYQTKAERMSETVERMGAQAPTAAEVATKSDHLSLQELRIFVESKQGVVLDARPNVFFRLGHIPGALSLPRNDFENGYAVLRKVLEVDKNQAIVVYCSEDDCDDSELAAQALRRLGYTNVRLFKGGWAAWVDKDLPQEMAL